MVSQIIFNSIITGSLYALCALSFVLMYRTTKFFNLSHGMIITLSGYSYLFFTRQLNYNKIFAILLAIMISGAVGYILEKIIFLKLRQKGSSPLVLLLVSLGCLMALQSIMAIIFTSQYQVLVLPQIIQGSFEIWEANITKTQVAIAFSWMMLISLFFWWLKKSATGAAVRAISDNEEMAKIIGFNTNKIIGLIVFISSAIAGLLGVLIGFDSGIDLTFGTNLLFKGIIATIIGGAGTIYGCIIGSFFLGTIENLAVWKLSGNWKDFISFTVMIIFLIANPLNLIKEKIKIWNS